MGGRTFCMFEGDWGREARCGGALRAKDPRLLTGCLIRYMRCVAKRLTCKLTSEDANSSHWLALSCSRVQLPRTASRTATRFRELVYFGMPVARRRRRYPWELCGKA